MAEAQGPERIAPEWWRRTGERTRDYYVVEDTAGRRFWLYRAGLYGRGASGGGKFGHERPRGFARLFPAFRCLLIDCPVGVRRVVATVGESCPISGTRKLTATRLKKPRPSSVPGR